MLDFSSLQPANSKNHQQLIHRRLWMGWGLLRGPSFIAQTEEKAFRSDLIVPSRHRNQTYRFACVRTQT